jgi:hypothetical protein
LCNARIPYTKEESMARQRRGKKDEGYDEGDRIRDRLDPKRTGVAVEFIEDERAVAHYRYQLEKGDAWFERFKAEYKADFGEPWPTVEELRSQGNDWLADMLAEAEQEPDEEFLKHLVYTRVLWDDGSEQIRDYHDFEHEKARQARWWQRNREGR